MSKKAQSTITHSSFKRRIIFDINNYGNTISLYFVFAFHSIISCYMTFLIYFVYNIDYISLIVLCTVLLLLSAFRQANEYCRRVYFHPKFTNKLSRWANKFCWTYPSVHSYIHVYVCLFEWLYAECFFFLQNCICCCLLAAALLLLLFFLLLTYNFLSSAFKENRANE